jgi:hypothetical protein
MESKECEVDFFLCYVYYCYLCPVQRFNVLSNKNIVIYLSIKHRLLKLSQLDGVEIFDQRWGVKAV